MEAEEEPRERGGQVSVAFPQLQKERLASGALDSSLLCLSSDAYVESNCIEAGVRESVAHAWCRSLPSSPPLYLGSMMLVSSVTALILQESLAVGDYRKCPPFAGRKGRITCSKPSLATYPVSVPLCVHASLCVPVHICVKARGQSQIVFLRYNLSFINFYYFSLLLHIPKRLFIFSRMYMYVCVSVCRASTGAHGGQKRILIHLAA